MKLLPIILCVAACSITTSTINSITNITNYSIIKGDNFIATIKPAYQVFYAINIFQL